MATTTSHRSIEGEEDSYPCALYYVQSPSVSSQANNNNNNNHTSNDCSSLLSPLPDVPAAVDGTTHRSRHEAAASRSTLSRYSSSRGSTNSFLHHKKIPQGLRVIGVNDEEGSGGDDDGRWMRVRRLLSLDAASSSCFCLAFQIAWRLMVSFGVAVLVFFLVTRPPPPRVSFKMVGFRKFDLGEGLDNTGVVTKILSCNSSVDMEIENNSKVFSLHVHPPTMEMAFGNLVFRSSEGKETYVTSYNSLIVRLYVGVKSLSVYGAGRNMEDMLKSGHGLPLVIRVKSRSTYHVVGNLVRLRYRHHGECLLLLSGSYDKKNHRQIYKGDCSTTSHP